jgi:predicted RNase H-like HicB family nuclease
MKYAIAIHHEEGKSYGVTVPDLPGCFSAGDTLDEAIDSVQQAIKCHITNESSIELKSTPLEKLTAHPDYKDALWVVIDINLEQ